jgi:hypothetical protein
MEPEPPCVGMILAILPPMEGVGIYLWAWRETKYIHPIGLGFYQLLEKQMQRSL